MSARDSTVAAAGPGALSGAAHSLQNFAPGLLLAPQPEHFITVGEAHSLQNFAPSGFSAEQFWQRIDLSAIYSDQAGLAFIYHPTRAKEYRAPRERAATPFRASRGGRRVRHAFVPAAAKFCLTVSHAHVCAQIKLLSIRVSRFGGSRLKAV